MGKTAQHLAFRAWRLGKISEMSTQITVPWPTACAAMKAKMQSITISPPEPAALEAAARAFSAVSFTSAGLAFSATTTGPGA